MINNEVIEELRTADKNQQKVIKQLIVAMQKMEERIIELENHRKAELILQSSKLNKHVPIVQNKELENIASN